MTDLSERIALVTGASGRIGREICRLLDEVGVTVISTDRATGDTLADNFRELDVTDEAAWHALAANVERDCGLVHNAGVAVTNRLQETSVEELRLTVAVNVEGPFFRHKSLY